MAGIIKRYWESTKNQLARYADVWRVVYDMGKGECFDEFCTALEQCDRDWNCHVDRKPAEVVPTDLDKCVRATAALRRCMQRKPDVFREYIVAMDKGIEENERMRLEPDAVEMEGGRRFRWWTGMRNS
jgi:hypothetical protein